MRSVKLFIFVLLCFILSNNIFAKGLKTFKLANGLSVFVWEDETVADVFGMVAVNVGSKEDPEQYTGLAHYLEHLMFKGTEKIGSLEWEKEKPLYEQIIAKYDEHAQTTDPVQRKEILQEINQLTQKTAQYYLPHDFSCLAQNIGCQNINAVTSYDYTLFYNSFPPGEIYKWLELYSERLIDPVFRNFQPELETVYEEYNMYQDMQGATERNFIMNTIFQGHPYARPIIGLPEHLKNPQLSKVITFYQNWYVPANMVLILAGNIKTEDIVPIVQKTFGRLKNKPVPERTIYPETPLNGRKEVNANLSNYTHLMLAFPGITSSSKNDIALDICTSILSNSNKTGLLDKLVMEDNLRGCWVNLIRLNERGNIEITANPCYDISAHRYESLRTTENKILKEIKKIQDGKIEEWRVKSIKRRMILTHNLAMESPEYKANIIMNLFFSGKNMEDLINYNELVESVTFEQIMATAKKYFGSDYYAIYLNEGNLEKKGKLEKPPYDPVIPLREVETDFGKIFRSLPVNYKNDFADMNSVTTRLINERSKFFYTYNPENEFFTLTLKYGVGTKKMPKLELAASLMNDAGIMEKMEAQEVKQVFSNLGATCRYSVDDNYLYVTLEGIEINLEEDCLLLMQQCLFPKLDENQMDRMQRNIRAQRQKTEISDNQKQRDALKYYLLYGKQSPYVDRLPLNDIAALSVSNLAGEFQRATGYEAEIHYTGSRPVEEVYDILSKNLPWKQGEKISTSPEIRETMNYSKNTVFFLPNRNARQSFIYFFVQGDNYTKEQTPYIDAFNQYINGNVGSGLIPQEIREYRSMAYTATGHYEIPLLENKNAFFIGYVGTQADKTMDAMEVFYNLLINMPQYVNRMQDIKEYLKETASIERPHFRQASQIFQNWKLKGYTQSPAETHKDAIERLTFEDIVKFYNEYIKGKPIAIAVTGNPKFIDKKMLAKYGKFVKLTTSQIFSSQ